MVKTLNDYIEMTQEEEEIWKMKANDLVNTPNHYTIGGIETIDYIRAKLTSEQLKGYYLGNLLKYLSRAQHKDGVQDYRKAEVYLKWLIELEGQGILKK